MAKVTFHEDRCKGCKLCIYFCPKQIIEIDKDKINAKGFYSVRINKEDECTGCNACAIMCPDCAIEVER